MRIFLISVLSLSVAAPLSAQTIGWRTDGTGRYPNAVPPIHWGVDKNVVWKSVMPSFSVAMPVIVGDKIFTTSDPTSLICVNKTDGTILWEKKCSRDEIPWTAEEKLKLADERELAKGWNSRQQELQKAANVAEKVWQQEKSKDARAKFEDLRKQIAELERKRKSLPLLMRATDAPRNGTPGYSMCTPVYNGKQLFTAYGNGLVACYDLDGTRRWLTLLEHTTAAYGHGSSPTLVGDKLIVHYADLVALNIKDGSEAWRVPMQPLHGTCIRTRIGDVDVILHPTGRIVRVSDGTILAEKLGQCGDNAPILQDGIAYFIAGNATAIRLPASLSEQPAPLWKKGVNLKGGDYWFASPVYHDGLIYAINGNCNYSVLDAKTGKVVHADHLDFGGRVYPSICLAGKYIYVTSDNGTTIVLEPGREFKEIARNTLETFRSTPVFEGRRMYVRTQKHLWCIGQ